ncbi:MAG: hypothetical protein F4112_15915 [Holophagales bacterium]|nr:hypothetical protein [Holophagales bacterium]MYD21124.1 hypothetical protein [Holophagales bacterium]MYI34435.1 hypothetical protein [Holophagales bacterium]
MNLTRLACGLLFVAGAFQAAPASAIVYGMPTDESMVDRSPIIVFGEVLSAQAGADPNSPPTDYLFVVEEVLKGFVAGSGIMVRQPGGADGTVAPVADLPMLAEGNRVLLFLHPEKNGAHSIVEQGLGMFFEARVGDGVFLLREPSLEGAAVPPGEWAASNGGGRHGYRDGGAFRRWIVDRAVGVERPSDYLRGAGAGDPAVRASLGPECDSGQTPTVACAVRASASTTDFNLDPQNRNPKGITFADGRFYILDSRSGRLGDGSVYVHSANGRRIQSADFPLDDHGEVLEGITYADGRLYVVGGRPARAYAYDLDGQRLDQNDFPLAALSAIAGSSTGITYADDRLYVVDQFAKKVIAYFPNGKRPLFSGFDLDPDNRVAYGITYAKGRFLGLFDRFFVVDALAEKVFAYSERGRRVESDDFDLKSGTPQGITYADGRLYVVGSGKVSVYSTSGERAPGPDLVVENPKVTDDSLEVGDSFRFAATVRNRGEGPSAATTLSYYRSSSRLIDTSDRFLDSHSISALGASASDRRNIGLRTPSRAGTYYYGACVDPVAGESHPTNNCSEGVRVTVTGSSAPDLVVDNPKVTDDRLAAGEWFRFAATVRNQGEGRSAATTLRYYVSSAGGTTFDTFLDQTDPIRALSATGTDRQNVRLQALATPGTYYYGACVVRVAGETNTGNNCSEGVRVTVTGSPVPDLVVENPKVTDDRLEAGEQFRFAATVRNQGKGRSAATTLRYYRSRNSQIDTSSDTFLASDRIGGLSGTATERHNVGLRAPRTPGTYYYGACVDSVSGESNRRNNCSEGVRVTVTGPPAPDLVVEFPLASEPVVGLFEAFSFSATVVNKGNRRWPGTTLLRYYVSADSKIDDRDTQLSVLRPVGALDVGGSSTWTVALRESRAGTYYYGACVGSVADESNTSNNCSRGVRVTVKEGAKVTEKYQHDDGTFEEHHIVFLGGEAAFEMEFAERFVLRQGDVLEQVEFCVKRGESRRIPVRVRLLDESTYGGPGVLKHGLDLNLVHGGPGTTACFRQDVPGAAGIEGYRAVHVEGPMWVGVSWLRSSGLSMGVDSDGRGQGRPYARGRRTADELWGGAWFEVEEPAIGIRLWVSRAGGGSGTPDLAVEPARVAKNGVAPGEELFVDVAVVNLGSEASDSTTLRLYRSSDSTINDQDTEVRAVSQEPLSPSGRTNWSLRAVAPSRADTYHYGACVDRVAGETNTGNNCSRSVPITVGGGGGPDLVVESESISEPSVEVNEFFTFSATVVNRGIGRSSPTKLHYYHSTDDTIDESDTRLIGPDEDVGALTSGGSSTKLARWYHSRAGTYYYGACVVSVPGESNTGNNCSARGVKVVVGDTGGGTDSSFNLDSANGGPTGITYANGRFYVVDQGADKVFAYGSDWRRSSSDEFPLGSHTVPKGITYANGQFYVVDEANNRVYAYRPDGSPLGDFRLAFTADFPNGIVYAQSRFFVLLLNAGEVHAYRENGNRDSSDDWRLTSSNGRPVGITYADGDFYVVDQDGGKVYAYNGSGSWHSSSDFGLDPENAHPGGIAYANGRFYVVDWADDKVYVYGSRGGRISSADFRLDFSSDQRQE